MAIVVDPDIEESTHHISLENRYGRKIGLIVASSQGKPDPRFMSRELYGGTNIVTKPPGGRFDDREQPYVAIEQVDFSGGRGQKNFERNRAKFFDSGSMWTQSEGKVYPAPLPKLSTGYRDMDTDMPGHVQFKPLIDSQQYLATHFEAGASYSAETISVIMRYVGSPGTLTVSLYSDTPSEPNAALQSATYTTSDHDQELISEWIIVDISTEALSSGTEYWVVVKGADNDDADNRWEVGCGSDAATEYASSSNGTAWDTSTTFGPRFIVGDGQKRARRWPFYHYGQLYMLVEPNDGTTPELYINGYRGRATGGTTTSLTDTDQSWTADELIGGVVQIIDGTGDGQYAEITDNTATVITADFDVAPSTDSDYIILGLDKWIEISGHGITKVTDYPMSVNQVCYFMQGPATNMRRMRFNHGAAPPAHEFAADGTNQFNLIATQRGSDGSNQIWVADDSAVSHGDIQDWGTNLTLTKGQSPITIGDESVSIRALFAYDGLMWAIKDDSLWAIQGDIPDLVLSEIKSFQSQFNGLGHTVQTPYLYFNLGPRLEQFYSKQMTDIGPNKDEGLPKNRQGAIVALETHPKWLFAVIDAGSDRHSSVMVFNGVGWHEIYRAPATERIRGVKFQVIPGEQSRLWIFTDRLVKYLPFPQFALEPSNEDNSEYMYESYVTTSWMSDNLLDVDKFWAHLKLFTENLDDNAGIKIEVDYRVDDETDWSSFGSEYWHSPTQEYEVGHGQVDGKRIQFRLRFYTEDKDEFPLLNSMVPDYVGRFPTHYAFQARVLFSKLADERMENLQGDEGDLTSKEILDFLEDAKNDPVPLEMRCVIAPYDRQRVVIDPASLNVLDVAPAESERLLGSVRLLGVD